MKEIIDDMNLSSIVFFSYLIILKTNSPLFFSFNKFNLISFYEKDHGERDGSSLLSWVKLNLSNNNIVTENIKIKLLK